MTPLWLSICNRKLRADLGNLPVSSVCRLIIIMWPRGSKGRCSVLMWRGEQTPSHRGEQEVLPGGCRLERASPTRRLFVSMTGLWIKGKMFFLRLGFKLIPARWLTGYTDSLTARCAVWVLHLLHKMYKFSRCFSNIIINFIKSGFKWRSMWASPLEIAWIVCQISSLYIKHEHFDRHVYLHPVK